MKLKNKKKNYSKKQQIIIYRNWTLYLQKILIRTNSEVFHLAKFIRKNFESNNDQNVISKKRLHPSKLKTKCSKLREKFVELFGFDSDNELSDTEFMEKYVHNRNLLCKK